MVLLLVFMQLTRDLFAIAKFLYDLIRYRTITKIKLFLKNEHDKIVWEMA